MAATTYNELAKNGDHTTMLRPLTAGEAFAAFAESSHGHVFKRGDGFLARCGGPSLCKRCTVEQQVCDVLSGEG